ncbi:MAG: hypothetical protein O2943_10180 [Actinomycetota bacterium]|nr:hypothetical protein [Verrucomicrobiota bacterium]MDA3022996.1 hypothetical protein [Actinomycetota bacterium]
MANRPGAFVTMTRAGRIGVLASVDDNGKGVGTDTPMSDRPLAAPT